MRLIGIDCATDPRKTGLALARLSRRGPPRIEDLLCPASEAERVDRLADWMGDAGPAVLAVDAPLGWPAPLADALEGHRAGAHVPGPANDLFRRATDRFVKERVGKLPLDVGADRIARTAYVALDLLEALRRRTGRRLPLLWRVPGARAGAIEVYPAGTLAALGLPSSGYKREGGLKARRALLAALAPHVDVGGFGPAALASDDALDAVVCVVAAAAFVRGEALAPPAALGKLARREGWIWVPSPV